MLQVVVEPHDREALAGHPLQERLASFEEEDLQRYISMALCS